MTQLLRMKALVRKEKKKVALGRHPTIIRRFVSGGNIAILVASKTIQKLVSIKMDTTMVIFQRPPTGFLTLLHSNQSQFEHHQR